MLFHFESGSGDHTVKIIDCKSGTCLKVLSGHRRTPWVVNYLLIFIIIKSNFINQHNYVQLESNHAKQMVFLLSSPPPLELVEA